MLGVDMCADQDAGTRRVTVVNYNNHGKLPRGARVTRDDTGKQFLVCALYYIKSKEVPSLQIDIYLQTFAVLHSLMYCRIIPLILHNIYISDCAISTAATYIKLNPVPDIQGVQETRYLIKY